MQLIDDSDEHSDRRRADDERIERATRVSRASYVGRNPSLGLGNRGSFEQGLEGGGFFENPAIQTIYNNLGQYIV